MTVNHEPLELTTPKAILNQSTLCNPTDSSYLEHELIQRFGSPEQPIHVNPYNLSLNNVDYNQPLILPIYNGELELIQCAIMVDNKPVQSFPEGQSKGFAYYGELYKDKPIIFTYNLEAFFKIAQTGYAVVLVVLSGLCRSRQRELKASDFEQIKLIIYQLSSAGYKQLYMPVRDEWLSTQSFQRLAKDTSIKLFSQSQSIDDHDFYLGFTQDESKDDIKALIDIAISPLPDLSTWGDLLPLTQVNAAPVSSYPIQALPKLVREAVQAIAEHVQAPIAMTAQCVIGALSHIAQAHINAPHPFNIQGEPCSLFLLTEGQSGSRKSTSRNLAEQAIIQHERQLYDLHKSELEQWKSMLAGLGKKDEVAFKKDNPPPKDPISRHSDITVESISGLFIDGDIRNASISSDEAGQFFGGHTMKSDTRNQALGVYAKLFDDGAVERSRSKSNLNGSGRAYDVRLTFSLQGQHEVLSEILKDPVLRGQGFLPRFLLTIPENLAGTRIHDADYLNRSNHLDPRLGNYWKRCAFLLDDCPMPHRVNSGSNERYVMVMNPAAQQVDIDFYNEIEQLQAKGQRYEYLQAFASRASQIARRLATVLAYFEGLNEIDATILSGACAVVRHSLGEWARYAEIEVVKENDAEKLFKNILGKCKKANTSLILKTIALKGAPSHLRKKKQFDEYLDELIESHYVRLVRINQSMYIEVNPIFLN